MIEERFFDHQADMFTALLEDCTARLLQAVNTHQRASFLVSGGSTPRPLYESLSQRSLPWRDITVALVDERWVNPDHEGSNEAFIHRHLLQGPAQSANYIATKNSADNPLTGLEQCEAAYQHIPRPFDLTILGMGADGHTASLFPHALHLETALDLSETRLCAAITAHPSEVTGSLCDRLSLSLYGLLQSRQLHLLITGEEKLAVYQAAKDAESAFDCPVSAVLQQSEIPVVVYWAP